jgi:hypothetical protein
MLVNSSKARECHGRSLDDSTINGQALSINNQVKSCEFREYNEHIHNVRLGVNHLDDLAKMRSLNTSPFKTQNKDHSISVMIEDRTELAQNDVKVFEENPVEQSKYDCATA